VDNTTKDF